MDLLPFLHQKLIFSPTDIVSQVRTLRSATTILARYQKQGYVSKIRRGLYCVNNIATKMPEADKYQIASSITPSAYVAYHSAMEYHGFAHQLYYDVVVGTRQKFNAFNFDGYHYASHLTYIDTGIDISPANSLVSVTNVERTIVDCIDRIDLCGGLEELKNCLQSIRYLRDEQLLATLHAYGKTALYKKTGFLLQSLQMPVSIDLLKTCMQYANKSITYLTSDGDSNQFCQTWRMYVPSDLLNINNSHSYEHI